MKANRLEEFEEKYPYFWLVLGLILTLFSYGIFNTGICAWIFAIPLIRFINNRTKWSSIVMILVGTVVVANITFFRLVEDGFNIMNQVFARLTAFGSGSRSSFISFAEKSELKKPLLTIHFQPQWRSLSSL